MIDIRINCHEACPTCGPQDCYGGGKATLIDYGMDENGVSMWEITCRTCLRRIRRASLDDLRDAAAKLRNQMRQLEGDANYARKAVSAR